MEDSIVQPRPQGIWLWIAAVLGVVEAVLLSAAFVSSRGEDLMLNLQHWSISTVAVWLISASLLGIATWLCWQRSQKPGHEPEDKNTYIRNPWWVCVLVAILMIIVLATLVMPVFRVSS